MQHHSLLPHSLNCLTSVQHAMFAGLLSLSRCLSRAHSLRRCFDSLRGLHHIIEGRRSLSEIDGIVTKNRAGLKIINPNPQNHELQLQEKRDGFVLQIKRKKLIQLK
ncbi:hypothetical protein P8452_02157 [Trifolium repens]|nr:hypothetical protein P8452_02157 [Trifolium repens]